jgi:hypothetical protein
MEMCVLSYASLNKEKTQDRHPNFYRRQDALRTTIVGKYSDKKNQKEKEMFFLLFHIQKMRSIIGEQKHIHQE